MGWEGGGRQSLEANPGAFHSRLKRLEDRNSDPGVTCIRTLSTLQRRRSFESPQI